MLVFGPETEPKDLGALVDEPGDQSGILIEGSPNGRHVSVGNYVIRRSRPALGGP
jgi:hypothetical protein